MRYRSTRGCLRVCIVLGCSMPGMLGAQSPPPPEAAATAGEPAGYRALVDEAKREYDAGNFGEARALFAKAHALHPSARVLRGLGMTEFELRNYGDCIAALEQALAAPVRPLEGALRTETEQLLERARSFVARLRIATDPSPATVIVDGMPMQLGREGSLMLEVGNHVLEFRAEGHAPARRVLKVIGGEDESLRVVLPKDAPLVAMPAPAPAAVTTPAPVAKRRLVKNPWLWTGVGVVTAAAATGIALGMSRGGGTAAPDVEGAYVIGKLR